MAKEKFIVKLNSPIDTPENDKIYVIEYKSIDRIKVRKKDVDKELENLNNEIILKQNRKIELENIKAEIEKL